MSSRPRPSRVPDLLPPPRLRLPAVHRAMLANGLRVLHVESTRLPIADALLVFPAGAASGSTERAGLANLTAELLDSGTASRSEYDIAAELERLGARMDASSGWDHTTIALHALAERLPDSLDLLADIARRPSFPDAEFMRGRAQRLAEIIQEFDDPEIVADLAIARAIHGPHHVYGVAAAGTRASVERLERDALVRFHDARYRPNDAFLVLAGDIGPDRAVELITQRLGDWEAGPARDPVSLPAARTGPTTIHLIDRPDAPQSEIRIGSTGVSRSSPDYFPLVVLNTVLGGSFTSRLNVRLREEGGYTYGAYSGFAFRVQAGPFVAGAAVFTEATGTAIAECLEEIARIREEPVPAGELNRARTYMMLGLPRGFETCGGIASRLADVELHGLGDSYWEAFPDRIEAIGPDAVLSAAQRTLDPGRLQIVVVGDAGRVRAPLEALGVGPVIDMQPPE